MNLFPLETLKAATPFTDLNLFVTNPGLWQVCDQATKKSQISLENMALKC